MGTHVNLVGVSEFSRGKLVSSLRRVRLRGFDGALAYSNAQIELVEGLDPGLVAPAQNYVLRENVERVGELRTTLREWGIDPLRMTGGACLRTTDDPTTITLLPPVIEESVEPDGRTCLLVSDGLHRLFFAYSHDIAVSAVVVRGASHPYYAFPLPEGWNGVKLLESLPAAYQKKVYRQPDNYKALFRDFNGIFPNVQSQRRRSNPDSLQPGQFHGVPGPANEQPQ